MIGHRFLLVLGLTLTCGAAMAQNAYPQSSGSTPGEPRSTMEREHLSAQQREQVNQIMQEEHERMRQRLSQVLTPTQMERWEQRHQRMRHHDQMMDSWKGQGDRPMRTKHRPASASSSPSAMDSDNT